MQPPIYWPVGSSLRFTPEIANSPECGDLVGTLVLVLTPPRELKTVRASKTAGRLLEQKVYAFAAGEETWVQTDLLEPIPVSMLSAYRSRRWPVQKS